MFQISNLNQKTKHYDGQKRKKTFSEKKISSNLTLTFLGLNFQNFLIFMFSFNHVLQGFLTVLPQNTYHKTVGVPQKTNFIAISSQFVMGGIFVCKKVENHYISIFDQMDSATTKQKRKNI
jgi:hypothetical protein